MSRIRNDEWRDDQNLESELKCLKQNGYQNQEILNFMERDFSQYAWSERTLKRRIAHFELRFRDTQNTLEEATAAIKQELKGPSKTLGYRAMNQKLRMVI